MSRLRVLSVACLASGWLFAAWGATASRVDNFTLLDQHGAAHELYYLSNARAVAIMIQGNGCSIARSAWPAFRALRETYAERGVAFLMLNSNLEDDRASVRAESEEYGIDAPILIDETQLVGESLGLVRAGELLVIDPKTWQVAYRGPIDDRLAYDRQAPAASEQYARDALDAVLAGKAVGVAQRDGPGCPIDFPDARPEQHAAISYSETIAPLLKENCVECHRPGGLGPWAMTEYRMVLGFAPMIREVLRTDRMPPWHSDPHVGEWFGDRSLKNDEIKAIVHWIEAGAKRGSGPDPLAAAPAPAPATDWALGEPDLVLSLPAFEVPATGVVEYQYPFVENPLDRDVWVAAAAILPGDRTVVHHVLAGHSATVPETGSEASVFENYLHGYAPGIEFGEFPDGTGVLIQRGGAFVFQAHYTPVGRASTDVTRIGLYFHDEPPKHVLRNNVVVNPTIEIPPGAARHEETAYLAFDKDAILYSLFPHAHYRGYSSRFMLRYPDGSERLLLSVPRYDFNWQRGYAFAEPLEIPAGSRLIHATVYDNSPQNPANPDPARTVPWGLQSWDEMLYGAITYRWKDETSQAPTHDPQLARLQQMFGYSDRDMNGSLSLDEMSEQMRQRFAADFDRFDRDDDGGLDVAEYRAALRERSASQRAPARSD